MTFPKNQQTRQRGKTLREAGAEPFGSEPKPMLNAHHERKLLGGHGLIGSDKSQGELRGVDAIGGQPSDVVGTKAIARSHQDAQHGADVRGSTVQKKEALPEGLRRERKGPYDKKVGRTEDATQIANRLERR